jgi:hypothetical protein
LFVIAAVTRVLTDAVVFETGRTGLVNPW